MRELFEKYNIKITSEQEELFEIYYDTLIEYNSKFNLTAITEKKEVYLKHFIDSAIVCDKLNGKNLIDVGSGGGFPALPIKILRKDISVTMLEATGKKCEFLKELVKKLNLKDVFIINGRAEDLGKSEIYREKFDICTARAVARLNSLCEYCMPLVKKGGTFVAFKGNAEEEVKEAQNAIKILGGKIEKTEEFYIEESKRALIFIKKVEKTDKKYPRGQGKERKNPL